MKFGLPQETIQKIKAVFEKYPSVEKVIIYGSRAKGNYKNGSDIDLTVLGEITDSDWTKLYFDIDDLLTPYTFDLSLLSTIENPDLVAHINEVGQTFYAKNNFTHHQVSVTVSPDQIDCLSDIFMEQGADAVSMTDAKDEPLFQLSPEDQPHWQQTTVHALFDAAMDVENIISAIKNNYPEYSKLRFHTEKIGEKNWVAETQKQFHAQAFGALWVCPQWEKDTFLQAHPHEKVIFIEPGLAFGTGTHPTTQLCLTWVANHISQGSVIDYGCGSGILALGALAMGADLVYATDHDIQALESTHNNMRYNAFDIEKLQVKTTDQMLGIKADIILANILANPLIELAPTLTALLLPHGKLILSGVLKDDADRVFAAYQNHFTRIDMQEKDGWVLMELVSCQY